MSYIFVSYAHSDAAFVRRLTADLQRAGASVWYDMVGIAPGQEWASAIRNALLDASVALFISSSASNASDWVKREVDLAVERKIPIIPVIVDEVPSALQLRSLQWIDFRSDYQTAFNHLLARLPSILRGQQPLIPEKPKSKGYVFISYAEEDAAFAQSLREFLKARGYGYWDFQESNRDYHKQFSLELEEIIKGAAATLALFSPDWKKSK